MAHTIRNQRDRIAEHDLDAAEEHIIRDRRRRKQNARRHRRKIAKRKGRLRH